MKSLFRCTIGALLLSFPAFSISAQTAATPHISRPLITERVDDHTLVTLAGNTHPLAKPQFDQGEVAGELPMQRMLLVLKRSPEAEAALRELLDIQQTKGSPTYGKWLKPEEFGQQFGAHPQDIAAVTGWLQSNHFSVDNVAKGRQVIEFSGTAAQVAQAFHTHIHSYLVNGEHHYSNAGDPQIPAALAPAVAGIASLNDFHSRPASHLIEKKFAQQSGTKPLYQDQSNILTEVAPGDFYRIYDEVPALTNSRPYTGAGQIVAIVGRSNIDARDYTDFRQRFVDPDGFSGKLNVIVNGIDPGISSDPGEQAEATLDAEWSSATAPNATIDFVVSASTNTTDGVDLSQLYIVDNDLAPVMSASFGSCEAAEGNAENQLQNAIEEQAAAQGITSVVSSGDSGAAGCEPGSGSGDPANPNVSQYGLNVSGTASTPFNVAVGGTEFNEGGISNMSKYWDTLSGAGNLKPRPDLSSAYGYIPEVPWNESCAPGDQNCPPEAANLYGGGGGASSCAVRQEDASGNPAIGADGFPVCKSGYAKPSWQTGIAGIPADGVRDLPDISFTAAQHDGYAICFKGSCRGDDPQPVPVGGTSVSTPAFAGIMAVVNEWSIANKLPNGGRQGQADYVLYALAKTQQQTLGDACSSATQQAPNRNPSCTFYDITTGDNSVPCLGGSRDCSATQTGTYGRLKGYSAGPGYDQATGLGSLSVRNLLNNWGTVAFQGTTSTLNAIQPQTFTHGQPARIGVQVKAASGSGTPAGDVSIVTNSSFPNAQSIAVGMLASGSFAGSVDNLPGGTYQVQARYAGDGTYASSISNPVTVTVNPESSRTILQLTTIDGNGNLVLVTSASVPYGSVFLNVSVGAQAQQPDGIATGNVNLTIDGKAQALALSSLSSAQLDGSSLAPGMHTAIAAYAGDASYQPSTSGNAPFTISKANPVGRIGADQTTISTGQSVHVVAGFAPSGNGKLPTGTATIFSGTTQIGVPIALVPAGGNPLAVAVVDIPAAQLGTGNNILTAQYSGDGNYNAGTTSNSVTVNDTGGTKLASFLATSSAAAPVASGAAATSTITITPSGGFTGVVALTCNVANPSGVTPTPADEPVCTLNPASAGITGTGPVTTTLTVTTKPRPATTGALHAPADSAHPKSGSGLWWLASGGSSMACLLLMGLPARRRRVVWNACLIFAAAAVLSAGIGCGGGSSHSGSGSGTSPTPAPPANDPGTPAGTYTVSVNAASGQLSQTTNVAVAVQ